MYDRWIELEGEYPRGSFKSMSRSQPLPGIYFFCSRFVFRCLHRYGTATRPLRPGGKLSGLQLAEVGTHRLQQPTHIVKVCVQATDLLLLQEQQLPAKIQLGALIVVNRLDGLDDALLGRV